MAVSNIIKSRRLAALAAGLALVALPGVAFAQQDGRHHGGRAHGGDGAAAQQSERVNGPGRGWGDQRSDRGERRGHDWNRGREIATPQAVPAAPVAPPRAVARGWSDQDRNERRVERRDRDGDRRTWSGDRNRDGSVSVEHRNRTYADPDRNREYRARTENRAEWRGRDNDNWRRDNDNVRRDNENWRRDNDRSRNDGHRWSNRGDHRQWSNDWRRDQRYNWRGWRDNHRDVYRMRPYYAPYRNWSYRRFGIGFRMDSLFFGSNYWIGDPGYYRLPPAYGPYRWVRYYDDALLVDIYTGEVVDAIYDFFW